MNLFGFEISRKSRVSGTLQPQAGWQLRPVDGQGPFTADFAQFIPRKIQATFYEFLVESLPICGAAIDKLVTLDGLPIVTGQNQKLVEEISEWMQHVPVNDIQNGLQAFHQGHSREAFEQGFGLGEFVTDAKRTDIIGLRVADSKFIRFSREPGVGLRIYQKADNDMMDRELNQANLLYFSINNENQNPYGVPILRGCEFVTKVMTTIQHATGAVWERFGDPSFSVIYKTSKRDGADLESRRKTISDELNTALRAKAGGKSADFVRAIDKDSDLTIAVIGADGQVLDMDIPLKCIIQDVCGKVGLPAWMLGYSFSTTERRANFEAEMVLADVVVRQTAKGAGYERLIKNLLTLRGRTWKPGDWTLEWKQVNLHDLVAQAQARFLNAQADMMTATGDRGPGTGKLPSQLPIEAIKVITGAASHVPDCDCGCKGYGGGKETQRPTPWPEMDAIEQGYEADIKTRWEELRQRILTVAKLTEADIALGMSGTRGAKEDLPPVPSPWSLSLEQRAAILDGMNGFIGEYAPKNADSPLVWYYGQAYSAGLIQAARMVGQDRPALDLIRNSETYDELVKSGFGLLKDNATQAIQGKVLAEMEAHVIAGSNPLTVASRLNKLFGDQNSSWERLVRTEMASASERAKLDEWGAWEVKKVDFVPAPDGCSFCMSLKGGNPYDINTVPVPGSGTHPRCRCSTRPSRD